jgi:hypothetical protein
VRRWQERPRVYLLSRRLVRRAARYGSPSTSTVLIALLTLVAGGAASSACAAPHTSERGTGGSVVPSASSMATPSSVTVAAGSTESFVVLSQSLKADVGWLSALPSPATRSSAPRRWTRCGSSTPTQDQDVYADGRPVTTINWGEGFATLVHCALAAVSLTGLLDLSKALRTGRMGGPTGGTGWSRLFDLLQFSAYTCAAQHQIT